MKKSFKRTLAKGLSVVMALSMLAIAPADDADAAKAKKPKMAKKTYSVTVGKKVTVKISSKKKVKKTTWSLSKKDKKKVSLSKKKKTSVVVKGKKASTTATLKATVKVGSKNYKLSTKVKVKKKTTATKKPTAKPTTKPTAKATTAPTKVPQPTELVIKDKDDKAYTIDQTKTLNIPVTSLNESVMSCDDKHDLDKLEDYAHTGAEYSKNGINFTTKGSFNYGAAFYLDPITSESDLEDVDGKEGVKDGFTKLPKEGKGKAVDIGDYDVIRIAVKTAKEVNVRAWNKADYDKFVSGAAGWPGQTVAVYSGWDGAGRGDYAKKEPVEPGSDTKANVYYKDKAQTIEAEDGYVILPVKELVKAGKQSSFVALGVCGQFKGQDITIKSIELMKVKNSKPVTAPASVKLVADGKKTKIVNSATLAFTADVLDKNEQAMAAEKIDWSVTGEAATIEATETGATLTADATKTGEVTVVATSKTDATVKAEYKVQVCDPQTTLSLGFTNEYTTYTIDEMTTGVEIKAQGLNGAGEVAGKQPEAITVKLDKAVDGFTYEDNKLKATKAGEVTLVASSEGLEDAKVTIKVVEGTRVALTAASYKTDDLVAVTDDNQGNVFKFGNDMQKITNDAFKTNADGSVQITTQNWSVGMAVKAKLPEGMTLANVKGLMFNYASDNVTGGEGRECIVDVENDPSQVTYNKALSAGVELYKSEDVGKEAYAGNGYDVEATWKWADVKGDVDLTVTEPIFRIGVNSADGTTFKLSNVIVLTGEPDPAVKYEANTAEVVVGDTCELTAKMLTMPKDDSAKSITFESSDTAVATVQAGEFAANKNTVTVTGVKAGTATITATMTTTEGLTAKATATVTVKDPSVKIDAVTKPIILQDTENDASGESPFITADAKMELGLTVTKASSANVTAYSWEVTDEDKCATLSNDTTDTVEVTATKAGTINLKVTVTIDGKDYTDTVAITAQVDKLATLDAAAIKTAGPNNASAYTDWITAGSNYTESSYLYASEIAAGSTVEVAYKYYDAFQNVVTGADLYQAKLQNKGADLTAFAKLDGTGKITYTNSTESPVNLTAVIFQDASAKTGVSYIVIESVTPVSAE